MKGTIPSYVEIKMLLVVFALLQETSLATWQIAQPADRWYNSERASNIPKCAACVHIRGRFGKIAETHVCNCSYKRTNAENMNFKIKNGNKFTHLNIKRRGRAIVSTELLEMCTIMIIHYMRACEHTKKNETNQNSM